jgi:hypothetical protein
MALTESIANRGQQVAPLVQSLQESRGAVTLQPPVIAIPGHHAITA